MKVYGVAWARLPGQSWMPRWSIGNMMNTGTVLQPGAGHPKGLTIGLAVWMGRRPRSSRGR